MQVKDQKDLEALLISFSQLILDAYISVHKRFLSGKNIFKANKLNLYQSFHHGRMSQSKVSFLYIAATSIFSISYFLFRLTFIFIIFLIVILLGLWLDKRYAFLLTDFHYSYA